MLTPDATILPMITTIRGGTTVLAKTTKYGIHAAQYTNRTQAARKAAELVAAGFDAEVIQPRLGPAFYIRID
jgi:hypothetical protein